MNQARSRAIDRLRRERRSKRVDDEKTTALGDLETPSASPRAWKNSGVFWGMLLEALTIDERRAIETAYFEELTYAEAAERLEHAAWHDQERVFGRAKPTVDVATGQGGRDDEAYHRHVVKRTWCTASPLVRCPWRRP